MKRSSIIRIAGYSGFILILSYLFYFLRVADISLFYYWQQSIPLPLGEALQTPGGISDLQADMFLEIMDQPFWGPLGVALLVVMVFFSLHVIFRRIKDNPAFFTLLLAALIPFILFFAYYRLPAGLIISITTGFILAAIHSLYSPRNLVVRSIYNLIAGIIVYMAAGAAGLFILIQAAIIQNILSKEYLKLVSNLAILVVPILYLPLNLAYTVKYAYLGSFLISEYNIIPTILYFSIFSPLLILLVFTGLNFVSSRFAEKRFVLLSGTGITIVIAVLFFSSRASINELEESILKTVQASFRDDWEKVLQLTSEQPFVNNLMQFEVNRALFQTGQLLENMFHYPQQYGEKGIFLEQNASSRIAIHMSDFYYDMGFGNEARHWATEAQMGLMRHPEVLKRLVISYMAIGNNETARKFLRILSRSRLNREWSKKYSAMIESNNALDDETIQLFIHNNPKKDFFASSVRTTSKLLLFYSSNQDNKMAFEFLIASYLLQHDIGRVVGQLRGFKNFGYKRLPRGVEEAMLIYLSKAKTIDPSLADFSIRQVTIDEFKDFGKLIANVKGRDERMRAVAKYRNTYWYYLLFTSPYAPNN